MNILLGSICSKRFVLTRIYAVGRMVPTVALFLILAFVGCVRVFATPLPGLPNPPVITSATTASGTVNQSFSYQITATNSPTSYGASGSLPTGLSFNSSTGLISGTPSSSSTFNVTVSATNDGGTDSKTVTVTITNATFTVPSSAGANGNITPVSQSVAQGNTTSFTVTPNTGYTASASGCGGSLVGSTYTTGIITTNCTVLATFTAINTQAPVITSMGTASGTMNAAFSYPITASNSPTNYGASGLPTGLSINTSSGLISGTPSVSGTFNVTVTATNAIGTGSMPVTITITTGSPAPSLYPTLSAPASVAADGGQQPRIKKWGNNIYLLNGGANQNLFFYKSTDNGATFTSTVLATPVLNGYEYEFCMDTNGYLYALWESSNDSKLYIRKSLDGGTSWSAAASVASGFGWIDQPSCHFSNGTLYVLFRAFQNLKIEFFLTKSSDSGNTFSTPVQATNNSTQEDGGEIAVYGNNVYVIYYDNYSATPNNIYLVTSLNGGASFGSPVQINRTTGKSGWSPAMAVDDLGSLFVAYSDTTTDGEGDLYVAKSNNGGGSFTHTLAADSTYRNQDYPKIFVDGNNYLHLLWNDNRDNKGYGSVYYARSINGGASYEANVNIDSLGGISNGSLYVNSDVVHLAVTDYKTSPYTTIFKKIAWLPVAVPAVTLNSTALIFANQNVGITSAVQSAMLTNTGNAALNITSIAANGDFAATNNCGASLAAGANCAISVTFTPTVAGAKTGAVIITSDAASGPSTISLSGMGVVVGTWTAINPDPVAFVSVAQDLSNPSILYGGSGNGLYKSTDGGNSWSPIGPANAGYIASITIDPVTTSTLYLNVFGGLSGMVNGLYKSIDGGVSWQFINGLPVEDNATQFSPIAISPSSSSILYVEAHPTYVQANNTSQIFKSIDGGATWSALSYSGMTSRNASSFAVDPATSNTVYAATDSGGYKSTDGGIIWMPLSMSGVTPTRFIFPNGTSSLIIAASNGGPVRSADGGQTWVRTSTGGQQTMAITIDQANTSIMYAAGTQGEVFRTLDSGQTWMSLGSIPDGMDVYDIMFSAPNKTLYVRSLTQKFWAHTYIGILPGAPTAITAVESQGSAVVSFSPPASDGGSTIMGYLATSSPGGITASGAASPITLTGLTKGTSYTFMVQAMNWAGVGAVSTASNPITPTASVNVKTINPDGSYSITDTLPSGAIRTYNFNVEGVLTSITATNIVATSAGANGSITPASQTVAQGNTTSFTVAPNTGYTVSASGCGGSLNGSTYTTGAITADCTVSATFTQSTIQTSLATGWNLLGNSVNAPLDVAATLGDATKVTTVWKWIPATSKWAFYTPQQTDGGVAYAATKGYDALATITINGGEGFWVNAKAAFTAQLPAGASISTSYFQNNEFDPTQNKLLKGWNLIAVGDNVTPNVFNQGLSVTPPATGVIPLNVTTLWAWDSGLSNWYFYAPSLEESGGLTNYITSKNYLDFTQHNKTLGQGAGFWVNRP